MKGVGCSPALFLFDKKIEIEKSIFDFPIGAKDIKIKEILTVSDIKFSKFLEKIYRKCLTLKIKEV